MVTATPTCRAVKVNVLIGEIQGTVPWRGVKGASRLVPRQPLAGSGAICLVPRRTPQWH